MFCSVVFTKIDYLRKCFAHFGLFLDKQCINYCLERLLVKLVFNLNYWTQIE